MSEPLVVMEGIDKSFPGVQALSGCRFDLRAGEVHALIGENGAGKSTIMKILTGVYRKDGGTIRYKGKEVEFHTPAQALHHGVCIIHQELNLMPHLTIAQNIFIGREPRRGLPFWLDDAAMNRKAAELLAHMKLDMDPTMKVSELTVARQQMVEIAKALSYNSEVLVMDEPTAALTESEIEELFRIIAELRAKGVAIVYISHRMEELKRVSDRVTVMRDGCWVATRDMKDVTIPEIISMMVGRTILDTGRIYGGKATDEVVLEVQGLQRGRLVRDVSFSLRKGEILGFAGLMGAGRTEVARTLFGADVAQAGTVKVKGKQVSIRSPRQAVANGIGYLSEDRKRYGIVTGLDVETNIAMPSMEQYSGFAGWMNTKRIRESADRYVELLRIKTPGVTQKVKFLSGGNQQKVVIGKWLDRDCDILIFDEPTRGIDVGAKSEIYKLLGDLAAQGKSIIMISSELPEVLRMSDRIVVMCEGRITGELDGDTATQEDIMALATKRGA